MKKEFQLQSARVAQATLGTRKPKLMLILHFSQRPFTDPTIILSDNLLKK